MSNFFTTENIPHYIVNRGHHFKY